MKATRAQLQARLDIAIDWIVSLMEKETAARVGPPPTRLETETAVQRLIDLVPQVAEQCPEAVFVIEAVVDRLIASSPGIH